MREVIVTIRKTPIMRFYKKTQTSPRGTYKLIEYKYDVYDKDGKIKETHLHNVIGKPAVIEYSRNKIKRIEYWYEGKRHNEYRPAIIRFNEDHTVTEEWYIQGEKLSADEVDTIRTTLQRKKKVLNVLLRYIKRS